jgi:hypothetical protein
LCTSYIIPINKQFNKKMEPFPFSGLRFGGGKLIRVAGRVVNKGREKHGAAGRQGTTGPPQVQGGRVAVAYRLFTGRLFVYRFQGETDFY